jgi:iron complex outermembrane receptor protein
MHNPAANARDNWRHRRRIQLSVLMTGVSAAMMIPETAFAQAVGEVAAEEGQVSQIVVTAQRRQENLQDVPVTVSAFSGEKLAAFGVEDLDDIGIVTPGVTFNTVVGYAVPFIRGIGSTSTGPGFENPVAVYVDGVYFASQAGALLSLNNIAAIEVDKGPQGTLFGRNATAGAIQIRTLRPQFDFQGKGSVSYGNYDTLRANAYVTGGINEMIATDLAVSYMNQGEGYGTNLTSGKDIDKSKELSLRSKIYYDSGDGTEITLVGDYARTRGRPAILPAPGMIPKGNRPPADDHRDGYGVTEPFSRINQWGVAGTVEQEIGDMTLVSITAYRNTKYHSNFLNLLTDDPQWTFSINTEEPHKQFSQEVQLQSGDGPFEWVLGGYYFWEHATYGKPTRLRGGAMVRPNGILDQPDSEIESLAAFAQGSYALSSGTKLTAGLRYTNELKHLATMTTINPGGANIVTSFSQSKRFEKVTWRLAVSQDIGENAMLFASYNRGFKSGGFNSSIIAAYAPEVVDAYEGGIKSELFGRRLRLNLAGFYYDYQNIQVTSYPGGRRQVNNGGAAEIYGVDLDLEASITPELTLSGGAELLHTEFTDFQNAGISVPSPTGGTLFPIGDATGNSLPRAPDVTFNLGANYRKELSFGALLANVLWSYNDGFYGDADNRLRQPAYHLVNASIGFELENGLGFKVWGKNLADEAYGVTLAARATGDFIQYGDPRTYGATISMAF